LIDKDTKTHAKRRAAIGTETVELIKSYRLRQVQAALAVRASLPPDAHVFSQTMDGSKPASPDGVTHRFQQLAARLGVRARLHDLRHFMVTQLVAGGVDWRTVSGRTGPRRRPHDPRHLRPLPASRGSPSSRVHRQAVSLSFNPFVAGWLRA
jgi:integrase